MTRMLYLRMVHIEYKPGRIQAWQNTSLAARLLCRRCHTEVGQYIMGSRVQCR